MPPDVICAHSRRCECRRDRSRSNFLRTTRRFVYKCERTRHARSTHRLPPFTHSIYEGGERIGALFMYLTATTRGHIYTHTHITHYRLPLSLCPPPSSSHVQHYTTCDTSCVHNPHTRSSTSTHSYTHTHSHLRPAIRAVTINYTKVARVLATLCHIIVQRTRSIPVSTDRRFHITLLSISVRLVRILLGCMSAAVFAFSMASSIANMPLLGCTIIRRPTEL